MAPEAVKTVFELMTNGESERVRLQAADSILDRGGAPRTKELAVSRAQEMWDDSDALVIDITSGQSVSGDLGLGLERIKLGESE